MISWSNLVAYHEFLHTQWKKKLLIKTIRFIRHKGHVAKSILTGSSKRFYRGNMLPFLTKHTRYFPVHRINLCCGPQKVPGYCGIDLWLGADMVVNLAKRDLPFRTATLEAAVCTSGINYFSRTQAQFLIREVWRVLKPGGIARFSVQDMKLIAQHYVDNDVRFFFQKLPDGKQRFEGPTIGDIFVSWFYGYVTAGGPSRYAYDYESLAYLFREAGFSVIERRAYLDSRLDHIDKIDNRPEQMFFLEAVK